MKGLILYHPKSDHEGQVLDYVHDYKRFKDRDLELLSLETTEGAEKARLYDVTSYPAVLVSDDDGVLQQMWQGSLPLMNDIDSYLRK